MAVSATLVLFILKTFLQDVLKMSWRCLEDVLKTSWRRIVKTNILIFTKTSWSRLEDVFWRDKAKVNIFLLIKTSSRRLLKTKTKDVFKTSSSRRMFAGQIISSTVSAFSSVVTVIGRPEPVLFFMDPSSLNHFKKRWIELSTYFFDLCSLHIP